MKFLALVSGGKDSCFNILHCLNQGHELVALANLHPKETDPEEIDSYMFQTVGSKAVLSLAQCLNRPLYRKPLSGNEDAVIDEMAELFREVLQIYPDVQGVSVGAIASTYQQIRVDTACQRLGLTSLTFLWQRDQLELLDEIIASGLEARIVKVAGIGLDDSHLGKTLADCRTDLLRLFHTYGLHPCGEGGEYETMVFDGPNFEKRMVMKDQKVVKHSNDSVFYLTFDTDLVDKIQTTGEVTVPPRLDEEFADFLAGSGALNGSNSSTLSGSVLNGTGRGACRDIESNGAFMFSVGGNPRQVFSKLKYLYEKHNVAIESTAYVSVLVADMGDFVSFNKIYNQFFDFVNPPSRALVQANVASPVQVTVFGTRPDPETKNLHVQGRSFWAPANIGPYSQVKKSFGIAYLAGQIGLDPATLKLVPEPAEQAVLALQNAVRILNAIMGLDNWTISSAVAFVTDGAMVKLVNSLWKDIIGNKPILVTAQVSRLPRDAKVEWVLQAFDDKYIEAYQPYSDNDDDDDRYVWPPKYKPSSEGPYSFEVGYHQFAVGHAPVENAVFQTVYSDQSAEGRTAAEQADAQIVPVQRVFLNARAVASVCISAASVAPAAPAA